MKIHVACLNWNGHKLLKKLIPGLINNLKNTNLEYTINVRDNGSKDESCIFLEEYKEINIFKINNNLSNFSQGMNYIINNINIKNNDIILFVNNDIEFLDNGSLKKMLNLMLKHNAAQVGARLMLDTSVEIHGVSDNTQRIKLMDKNDRCFISHNGIVFSKKYGNMCWNYRFNEQIRNKDYKNRSFQAVTAACCLVKAENFFKAKMFDENLSWAFEDVALSLDISINQKEKILLCGETNIIHLTSASLQKNSINKLFLNNNVNYFKNKWLGKYQIDHHLYEENENYNVII